MHSSKSGSLLSVTNYWHLRGSDTPLEKPIFIREVWLGRVADVTCANIILCKYFIEI